MRSEFVLLAALVAFAGVSSAEEGYFPPYITPCHRSSTRLRECVLEQISTALPRFTRGVPELGVPALDPVSLPDIRVDGSGLKLHFTNATMHGISRMVVSELLIDLDSEKFTIGVKGNLSLKANYRIEGQVLVLVIRGNGEAKVKTRNLDVVISSQFQRFTDASGEHFQLVSPSYTYTMERAQFQLQNLFNGNKELSDATHQFANQNWKQLMDDLGPPAVKQIVKTCVKAINKFFAKVTVQQVLPD